MLSTGSYLRADAFDLLPLRRTRADRYRKERLMKETAVLPDSESPLIPTSGKKIKMEDRKRPYNDTTDDGHPS